MLRCPYCFEPLDNEANRCRHCRQFIIDAPINFDFPALDKKPCLFCGKHILKQAKFCRHCQQWLDDVQNAASDIDPDDLV